MKKLTKRKPSQRALLEFDLTDLGAAEEFKRAVKATDAYGALWEVSQSLFRPARKCGFSDNYPKRLNELLDGHHGDAIREMLRLLEAEFSNILEVRDVNLNDFS